MFARTAEYPTAVASYDDEGVAAAIRWCLALMEPDDTMSVWTSLKSNLSNCAALDDFVRRYRDVEHITGRGLGGHSGPGRCLWRGPRWTASANLYAPAMRSRGCASSPGRPMASDRG